MLQPYSLRGRPLMLVLFGLLLALLQAHLGQMGVTPLVSMTPLRPCSSLAIPNALLAVQPHRSVLVDVYAEFSNGKTKKKKK